MNLDKWHTHVVMFSVKKRATSVGFHYFTPIKTVVLELVMATVYGFLKSRVLLQFQHFNFVGVVLVITSCNTYNPGSWQVCFVVGRAFIHN